MALLAAAAPYIGLGATALSVHSQIQAGKAADHQGKLIQQQKERDALAAQAEAQQVAAKERKKTRYVRSRALAVAGASGGGVSDLTVSNILTGIDTEGEMSALNALWSGDTTASGLREEGRNARREGRSAKKAGYIGGIVTAASGLVDFAKNGGSFFKKYGGKKSIGMGTAFSDFANQMPGPEWVA